VLSRIGLKSKVKRINAGRSAKHAFWDRLIFNKIADMFGGRLKTMILGAASADAKVQTFFRTALDCNIIQAYAQTENSVACTAQVPSDITTDNVGIPLPGIDVRLRSLPSMNYYVTDAPCPRGEVMVRSKCTFTQYLGEPEKTGEIKEGEWLATGDVGQINEDGTLAIIDRIKNILKTGRGTWVALERIENIYASHPLVQSVFIHGDELQRDLVGVVVPKSESFVPWACGIVKELHAVKAGLSVPEHINAIHCEPMPFENSPSRLLTSSAKLRRKVVSEHYQDEFDDLFAKLDNSTAPTVQEA
ncbi:medium-chain fatty acid-CoA ligase faa2, partial [Coemansia sp. RSA 2610]